MGQRQRAEREIILEGEPYENFLLSMRSDATKRTYDLALRYYMKLSGLFTVADLLCNSDVKQIQSNVIRFVAGERKRETSSSLISIRLAAIKRFYVMNDFQLNWARIYSVTGPVTPERKDRPYKREEIRKLLSVCDLRERMVILLLTSSGMRLGGLNELRLSDLTKLDKYSIYKITVYRGTKDEYYTFCTPEAAQIVDDWLALRKTSEKGKRFGPDSYLLRDKVDRNDQFKAAYPHRVSENAIQNLLSKKLVKAGLRPKTKSRKGRQGAIRHEVKVTHGFRKYFDTTMTKAGVPPLYVELLQGRTIGVKKSYFKPSEEDLLLGNDRMPGYLSAIGELSITEDPQLKQKAEALQKELDNRPSMKIINELQAQNEKNQQEIEMLKGWITGKIVPGTPFKLVKELSDAQQGESKRLLEEKRKKLDAGESVWK